MKLKTQICLKIPINLNPKYNHLNKQENYEKSQNFNENKNANFLPLNCLDWSGSDEIYFVSDDHQIYKWNNTSRECSEIAKLPENFIPTDLHWLLIGGKSSGGGKGSDTLLISSNDGRFVILNKNNRVERNITAHNGAISTARWSPDGAGLLTAGEDGVIKIWSRSGMLRSTVIQNEEPIICARWSCNSDSIVFSQGSNISVKPLAANTKRIRWRAHDGIILSLSWSSHSQLIASGGEDLRYKIWDNQGLHLFTSSIEENAITMVSFNNEKNLLLIGTFNMLKLCSTSGWCYHTQRFNDPITGSILSASWSSDGTQVCCGTFNGHLLVGHLIQQQIIRRNLKATTIGSKSLRLDDIINGSNDVLDFTERLVNFTLGYGHLLIATTHQIHIYNEKYINTPIIIDNRMGTRVLEAGKKFFMVLDSTAIWIYTYTGRLHLQPRYPGAQAQINLLDVRSISLGLDILIIKDCSDNSAIYIFNLIPGATRQSEPITLKVKTPLTQIAACRAGTLDDQFIVMIDKNRELYITESHNVNSVSSERSHTLGGSHNKNEEEIYKIGTQVTDIKWASECNILVGVHDVCYSIWYCPGEGAGDPTIIALTTVTVDASEFGKHITIESFEDSIITFHCFGAIISVNINIYCDILHRCLAENQWQQALNICRLAQNPYLWATLAAVATRKNQLEISEEAYSAALQIDKVSYLQRLKSLDPISPEYMAENSLMMGRLTEAETILLHNNKYQEAIELCIRLHNWHKALEIAEKHNNNHYVEEVLTKRKNYLKALGKKENDSLFLNLNAKESGNDND